MKITTTIYVEIDDKKLTLTPEQAQELYSMLGEALGVERDKQPHVDPDSIGDILKDIKKKWPVKPIPHSPPPIKPWTTPTYPGDWPPGTIMCAATALNEGVKEFNSFVEHLREVEKRTKENDTMKFGGKS